MSDFPMPARPEMPVPMTLDEKGFCALPPAPPSDGEKRSAPGVYSGYTLPKYNGFYRHSLYVPVRDGTRLALDYYVPALDGAEEKEPLPVVWQFTPYGRCSCRDGVIRPGGSHLADFIRHGYVVAGAELRGTGASFGIREATNNPYDQMDGRDINEWIWRQPWCNGRIGMVGGSYVGQTILSTLAGQPEHLRCAFITCTDFNKFDGWVRGGIARRFGAGNPDVPIQIQLASAVPVDGDEDRTLLTQAVNQHALNGPQVGPFEELHHRDDWSEQADGEYWNLVSASTYRDRINGTGAAIYLHGGLFDVFRRDTFILYRNLTVPKKLIVGPWYHCGETGVDMAAEQLRFFDYWLKDVLNGIMEEPPIRLKTQFMPEGKDWAFYDRWPLPEAENRSLFFGEGGTLSLRAPQTEGDGDDYTARYDIATGVESGDPADLDAKALVYTSAPLETDLRVTGHPLASLWVSADRPDADFFVCLTDVDPEGAAFLVTEGHLRASHRKTAEPPYDFLGLPWHPSGAGDVRPLRSGQPTRLDIDLMPTSYVLRKGHRIRVEISNHLRGFYAQEADPPAKIRLHRDPRYPSYIALPVVPD